MVMGVKRGIKVLFILLFISSLTILSGSCEDQYNHIWTAESPISKSNSWFGYKIEIDGEYIITSEPYADVDGVESAGKIHVYDLEGNLITTHQSPEPGPVDTFGYRLDAHDGILVAYEVADYEGKREVGKVHVFESDGTLQYTLQPEELYDALGFGMTVAIGEEILLISDNSIEMAPSASGKVHIYSHDGEFISTIYPPDPFPSGFFASTMEVEEGLIFITQNGDPWWLRIGPGYVYVFDVDGAHLMTLEASEKEDYACFGVSVSISGDKIVIGENRATVNGVKWAGKVHIYNTEGDHLRTLLSPNPDAYAFFGSDVAISGDIIVVGEPRGEITRFKEEGRAYVFNVDGTLIQNLTSPDPCPKGEFGSAVEIQDDVVVVGEYWAEVDGQPNSGRLHVYMLGAVESIQEPVEEGTTVVSETETDSESSGGIPGYPLWSIGLAILLISLGSRKRSKASFSLQFDR
jgi:hypothetical protein